MIITDFNKIVFYDGQAKTKAFAAWLNSQIFNELGGDAVSASVADYIRAGKDVVNNIAGLVSSVNASELREKYGESGWQMILDNIDMFSTTNGTKTAVALVESLAQMMHDRSENKTDKTHVIQKGYVDPKLKIDAEGNVLMTASGRELGGGSSESSGTSGSGLGTIAIVAGLVLVLILILKKK